MKLVLVGFWEFSHTLEWFGSCNYRQSGLEITILTIPKELAKNML